MSADPFGAGLDNPVNTAVLASSILVFVGALALCFTTGFAIAVAAFRFVDMLGLRWVLFAEGVDLSAPAEQELRLECRSTTNYKRNGLQC